MLIQINSGQGPKECEYACYMLYQELLKEYSSLEVVSRYVSDQKCLKSITFSIHEDLSYLEGTYSGYVKVLFDHIIKEGIGS